MSWQRFFSRNEDDAELKEEIKSFLLEEVKENMARGINREEARRQAYIKFGNPQRVREDLWQQNTLSIVDGIWRDLMYAVRALKRSPGFAFIVVVVIGLGIGASTALFTVVHSVLLRPLPFADPERLVMLYEHSQNVTPPYNAVAGGMFSEWRKALAGLEQMAIVSPWETYNVSGHGAQLPETVTAAACSWNLFSTLRVQPALGRVFNANEDLPAANATVVLSWSFWKRRFGGDPSILGQEISLDAKPHTVIGVMPSWFTYPGISTQLWTPIYHEAPASTMRAFDDHQFFVVGRLKEGVTLAQAVSGLDTVEKQIKQQYSSPGILNGVIGRSMLDAIVADYKRPLYVLLAATSCLLLIACLNVANLLIARSAARQREVAIRAALGSTRWRLIREQLTESLVLAFIGGLVGLAIANAAIACLTHVSMGLPRAETIHIDWVALLFAAGATLVSGAAAGIVPASGLRAGQMLGTLQESSRSQSGGRNRARVRKILVGSEVGLTVVLLIAAGLLLKSYQKLRSTDMGCAMDNLLSLRVRLPDARYRQPPQKMAIFEQLITRVRALPGVQAAGLVTAVPGQGWGGDGFISIVEHPPLPQGQTLDALFRGADPGYFAAIQIPILRGRSFTNEERLDRSHVAIISQLAAKQFFPGEDPIGRHLILDKPAVPYEIVGVVGDTPYYVSEEVKPIVYWPLYSGDFGAATIALRSRSDVESFAVSVQKAVTEVDRNIPVSDVLTMRQLIGVSTVDAGFVSMLTLAFALVALVLASVGLYGVLSYLVTQRTGEIGIRMALGAQRAKVLGLMLLEGLTPAWIGLASGLVGAGFVVQLIRSMLYGTSALDWITFAEATFVLSSVAALACIVPAWRASRLDPMVALRTE